MNVMGVDPGATGGLAVVTTGKDGLLSLVAAMPMPMRDVKSKQTVLSVDVLRFIDANNVSSVILENVHSMPRQGVASSFQFGRVFGAVESLIWTAMEPIYVEPGVWKKYMGLSKEKAKAIDLATNIFGEKVAKEYWPLKKHDGVAEAALMAASHILREQENDDEAW
jgi:crossover junction endodeoxyribonuclease RuvC